MDKFQAQQSFWSSFGLTAYDENTVPDDAEYPGGQQLLWFILQGTQKIVSEVGIGQT